MKAILISIKPKWCVLMMNGKKKIEVRKGTALYKAIQKLIDEYGYADIYVYCTKGKDLLYKCINGGYDYDNWKVLENRDSDNYILNGKVIFKFRCYKVEEITLERINDYSSDTYEYQTNSLIESEILEKSCLKGYELNDYLSKKLSGCAIHINDLEIFNKPKELSEFYGLPKKLNTTYGSEMVSDSLTKAPQSYCFIEVE